MICTSYTDCGNSNRFYRFAQSQPNVKQSMQSCVLSLRGTSMKNHEVIFHTDISATHSSAFKFHRCNKLLDFNCIFYFSSQLTPATSSHYLRFLQIVACFPLPSPEWVTTAAPLWPSQCQCWATVGETLRHLSECVWNRSIEPRKQFQKVGMCI